jgi:hypothetical protein
MVCIEHCLTLEIRARAACELEAMGLQAIGKAYAQTVRPSSSSPTLAGDPAALR